MLYNELIMSTTRWLCICSGVVSRVNYAAQQHAEQKVPSVAKYVMSMCMGVRVCVCVCVCACLHASMHACM